MSFTWKMLRKCETLIVCVNIILSNMQCTISTLKIIDYYIFTKFSVGVLLLDTSRAFDRVNYCKLFNELLERTISPVLLRQLLYMYTNQLFAC